jgi:hypothetical protein
MALAESHLAHVDGVLAPREEAAVLGSAVPLP